MNSTAKYEIKNLIKKLLADEKGAAIFAHDLLFN